MRERSKDKMRLEHIAEAINRLQTYAGGLQEDELRKDVLRYYGIVKNIEIIGEAARMVSDDFKTKYPDIEWRNISGMRNFLVHEYFNVDEETVFEVLHSEIPELKKQIDHLLTSTDWLTWSKES